MKFNSIITIDSIIIFYYIVILAKMLCYTIIKPLHRGYYAIKTTEYAQ